MRSVVRGVTPLRSIRMRERAYNFSVHFRVGRGARTVLYYNDCLYRHATRRKQIQKVHTKILCIGLQRNPVNAPNTWTLSS
jgi:hypothetical protein